MSKLPMPVARVRLAVRQSLTALQSDPVEGSTESPLVLVACSGGPDSMALAAAVAFVAPRLGVRAGLISVDHGLQPDSRAQAERVVSWAETVGLAPALSVSVVVAGGGGTEAAARTARYAAFEQAAESTGAVAVLLGHTQDDQAETVLLALARGSGLAAVAGMAARRDNYIRPLLGLSRGTTHLACEIDDLPVWHDPHNTDSAYSRSRLRRVLPLLEETIGPGVVAGLARTAELARSDAEYLTALAAACYDEVVADDDTVDAPVLAAAPRALRGRVLRAWALNVGAAPSALTLEHCGYLENLVIDWRGQGPVYLPGGITVVRAEGRLRARNPRMTG